MKLIWSAARIAALVFFFFSARCKNKKNTKAAILAALQIGEATMRRIGVFGGTFDPIHFGHLILAEQCRESGRLDQVWFLPTGNPPHKQEHIITRFEQRIEMIELAIAGYPPFRVDPIEHELPGLTYTANVLEELHRRHTDL